MTGQVVCCMWYVLPSPNTHVWCKCNYASMEMTERGYSIMNSIVAINHTSFHRNKFHTQSLGFLSTCSSLSSADPGSGLCMYSQRAVRGSDIRILSILAPGV